MRRALSFPTLAALLLTGCPSVEPEPIPPTPRFLGSDPSVLAGPDEARAGVIRADEGGLFGGIGAEGQPGDIKIWSDQVQFIISDAGRRHGWIDVGGTLVDADLVRTDGTLGRDGLDDAFLGFGLTRLFEATSVEIVSDGSDGGEARIRAIGGDVQWDFFARGIEAEEILLEDQNLAIVRDFVLDPGSDTLRVDTSFTNEGSVDVSVRPADGFMVSKEDFGLWFADHGLVDSASGDLAAVGYLGRHGEGVVSLWSADAPLTTFPGAALVSVASLNLFQQGEVALAPGESAAQEVRYTLGADTAAVEASRRTQLGEELVTISGTVSDGGPVAGARVHFVDGERAVGFTTSDGDGAYRASIPPGTWSVYATSRHPEERVMVDAAVGRLGALGSDAVQDAVLAALAGDSDAVPLPRMAGGRWTGPPTEVTLEAGGDEVLVDLGVPAAGRLIITVAGVPGTTAEVWHSGEVPEDTIGEELRERLGLPGVSARIAKAWTADGVLDLWLPEGEYDVTLGHSPRHDRADLTALGVLAGSVTEATAQLTEIVPRDGWWSVDAHLHAAPSMDGRLAMEDRLLACAAVGLDVPVTTDHDRFADYRPLAAALGLDDRLTVIPGTEVTTIVRGHFNLFPVDVADRTVRNAGALVWWDRDPTTTDELVGRVRAVGRDDSLLQVNHGRQTLGMMSAAGYDTVTGEPGRNSMWSWNFDLVEIVTEDDIEDWRRNRDDWFSFLTHGHRVVPIGASDSHDLKRACGLGRTEVFLDGEPTAAAVRDAIEAGRVVVSSGVTLRASLDGALPGSTAGPGTLQVDVSGPDWVAPATLNVWQDGVIVESVDLAGGGFSGTFDIEADADGWLAVEVDGGAPQGHLWGGHQPYAITGFLLDPDGDGWAP